VDEMLAPAHEEMAMAALRGILNGDLRAVAAYLRSDFPIHRIVRTELAAAIDHQDRLFRVTSSSSRETQKKLAALRNLPIAMFIKLYELRHPGPRKVAVSKAVEQFDVPERRVFRALHQWGDAIDLR
jgi:hypothetical protein